MLCNFWAISHLPLTQAITLSYSTPLFATILASLWLHEVVRLRRLLAILAGFAGILVLLQPWSSTFSPAPTGRAGRSAVECDHYNPNEATFAP